ncbi:MAG: heparinase II/III family protein [Bacteroidales bacterium]|nr:heparinase II/III family protein [Bacteroidales bacterium]
MSLKKFILSLLVCCWVGATFAQTEQVLPTTVLPRHPRLLLLRGEEKALRQKINRDAYWKSLQEGIVTECDRLLQEPVNERIQVGRRILTISRDNLRRIFLLSYAYRTTGKRQYLMRAEQEMLAAARFSDWNPSHFLDTSEMTMAMAIGYDWCYDALPGASREEIRAAIVEKGLKASLNEADAWFLKSDHNWNQVCNGGMLYGALAVFETDRQFCADIVNRSIGSVPLAMKAYAPDGAYPEGPGYWSYGTSYNVMLIAALEKIFGSSFGLLNASGFLQTGMYAQMMITPSLRQFCYSDNGTVVGFNPIVFWFYHKTHDPALLFNQKRLFERDASADYVSNWLLPSNLHFTADNERRQTQQGASLLPMAMIFGAGSGASLANPPQPQSLMWIGRGQSPVAVMRSSWQPDALFLGFKMGTPKANHSHLDVGSFIFEAEGVRWAYDFGIEDYNRLEVAGVSLWGHGDGVQRWDVFRHRTQSHNTLTFNDKPQSAVEMANLDDSGDCNGAMYVMSDLSAMYADQLPGVKRAVSLVDKRYAVIQDQFTTAGQFTKVRWNMLTEADKVTFTTDTTVLLEKGGKKLYLKVDAPFPVRFYTHDVTPTNSYDSPNIGGQFVGFEADLALNATQQVTVYLMPGEEVAQPEKTYSFD